MQASHSNQCRIIENSSDTRGGLYQTQSGVDRKKRNVRLHNVQ
jgi:hypothetical protein